MSRYKPLLAPCIVVLATATAGCGSSELSSTNHTATTEHAAGHDTESDARVVIGAKDYAFTGVPKAVEAGVEIGLDNTSASEVHELIALRLPDDETRTLAQIKALPPEDFRKLTAVLPATVIVAAPQSEGEPVLGDGTLNEPGRYLLTCAIPIGADPDQFMKRAEMKVGPPSLAGGPPHHTAGMIAELTVT